MDNQLIKSRAWNLVARNWARVASLFGFYLLTTAFVLFVSNKTTDSSAIYNGGSYASYGVDYFSMLIQLVSLASFISIYPTLTKGLYEGSTNEDFTFMTGFKDFGKSLISALGYYLIIFGASFLFGLVLGFVLVLFAVATEVGPLVIIPIVFAILPFGIYLAIRLSLTSVILANTVHNLNNQFPESVVGNNPFSKAIYAMVASWKHTKGHVLDLFVLHISLIGWYILTAVPFAFLFTIPYTQSVQVAAANYILFEKNQTTN